MTADRPQPLPGHGDQPTGGQGRVETDRDTGPRRPEQRPGLSGTTAAAGALFAFAALGMFAGDVTTGRLLPPRVRARLGIPFLLLLATPYLFSVLRPGAAVAVTPTLAPSPLRHRAAPHGGTTPGAVRTKSAAIRGELSLNQRKLYDRGHNHPSPGGVERDAWARIASAQNLRTSELQKS
uniref:Uncharacterized protein n=1 Tax=Streptomyces sp. NBC_01393 TaxID=2903851 RepID=A0AAU3IF11_9ACTN